MVCWWCCYMVHNLEPLTAIWTCFKVEFLKSMLKRLGKASFYTQSPCRYMSRCFVSKGSPTLSWIPGRFASPPKGQQCRWAVIALVSIDVREYWNQSQLYHLLSTIWRFVEVYEPNWSVPAWNKWNDPLHLVQAIPWLGVRKSIGSLSQCKVHAMLCWLYCMVLMTYWYSSQYWFCKPWLESLHKYN